MTGGLITSLLLILTVAWGLGYLFSRFGLPFMLGELLAGVILGPPLLGLVTASPGLELMAEFGIFFVMFYAGLEMDPRELVGHLWPSLAVALGGFGLPFALGYVITWLFDGTVFQSVVVGMGISITALAVQSVVLQSMRINRTELGHVIIGAAIFNDILAFIGLSAILGVARSGELVIGELVILLLKVSAFFGLTALVGQYIMPSLTRRVTDKEGKGFTFAMTVALAMAFLAELAGLHIIMGAFLAGQLVRREIMDQRVYEAIADRFYGLAYGFLVPIFFASLAFQLHLNWSWRFVAFSLTLTAAAVAGKLFGAGAAAKFFGHSNGEAAVVGWGMNGRGAVELVVATVVVELSRELMVQGTLREPLLTEEQFSALILMAFITTLMAPLWLKWAIMRTCMPEEGAGFCQLMDEARRQ